MQQPSGGAATLNFPDRRREDLGPPAGTVGRRASDALKMQCPFCGASESIVRRSRGAIVADEVRRTRRCANCGEDFPTTEQVDRAALEQRLAERERARKPDDELDRAA